MQLSQVQDYGVNMAITVPKYSDAGSTNTNLPTRRLTGFSAAGIRQMGAPGMALSSVGKNTFAVAKDFGERAIDCLLYTSPSPRDLRLSRMPSSA